MLAVAGAVTVPVNVAVAPGCRPLKVAAVQLKPVNEEPAGIERLLLSVLIGLFPLLVNLKVKVKG